MTSSMVHRPQHGGARRGGESSLLTEFSGAAHGNPVHAQTKAAHPLSALGQREDR